MHESNLLSVHFRFKAIIKFKTAYYSFYLPVALAFTMVNSSSFHIFLRSHLRKGTSDDVAFDELFGGAVLNLLLTANL